MTNLKNKSTEYLKALYQIKLAKYETYKQEKRKNEVLVEMGEILLELGRR